MEWIEANWKLVAYALAGIGVIGVAIYRLLVKPTNAGNGSTTISITNTNTQLSPRSSAIGGNGHEDSVSGNSTKRQRGDIRILFIDDDTSFQVVKILRKAGWSNTRIVKDVSSLDSQEIREADLLFVDIQGVGKLLDFKAEGLGLAAAIKKKHPQKKLVIYSALEAGDMFHEGLKLADATLSKSAEPYEFQMLVEKLLHS